MSVSATVVIVALFCFGAAPSTQPTTDKTIRLEDYVFWHCETDLVSTPENPRDKREVECWRVVRHSFEENAKPQSNRVRLVATQDVSKLVRWGYASVVFQSAFPGLVEVEALRLYYPLSVPIEFKQGSGLGLIGLSPDRQFVAGFRATFGPCAMVPLSYRVTEARTGRVLLDKSMKPALDGSTFANFGGFVQDARILAYLRDGETTLAVQRDGSVAQVREPRGIEGLFAAPNGRTVLCHESGQRTNQAESLVLRTPDLGRGLWSRPFDELFRVEDFMSLNYALWSDDSRLLCLISLDSGSDVLDRVYLVALDARSGTTVARRSLSIKIDPERSACALVNRTTRFDPFDAFSVSPRTHQP